MRRILFSILLICSSASLVFSNTNLTKIDSVFENVDGYVESVQEIRNFNESDLLSYLSVEKDVLKKAKVYNALCWKYFNSAPPKAMKYAKLQYSLLDQLNDTIAIVNTYDNLAWLYQGFSNHAASVKFMLEALKLKEIIGDESGVSVSLSGLASNYYMMNNYTLALKYFEQTLEVERLAKRDLYEAATLGNIGLCYVGLKNIDKGLEMYLAAVEIYVKNKQENEAASTYGNIGLIYLNEKKNYEEALFYLNKAAKFHEEAKEVSSLASIYSSLSELYTEQNDFTNGLIYGKKALEYAVLANEKSEIMVAHDKLAYVYYKKKEYKKAFDNFKISYNLKDTIFDISSAQQIAEMQTKYDTEKKEAENKLLVAQQKVDQAEIDRKKLQQNMLLILLVIVFFVIVYVVYSLQQKKKINKLLKHKNAEISEQKDVIEEKNKDITDSINYAQRIQNAILPDLAVIEKHFESFVFYQPKDIISGDFYWVKEVGYKIYFSVVDCTGHGVPGAMMSMIGYNSLNKIVKDLKIEDPGKILDELNTLVNRSFDKENTIKSNVIIKDGMDISICVINKETNILEYAGANNSLYLFREYKNTIEGLTPSLENEDFIFYETKSDRMKIGGGKNKKSYTTHKVQLQKNDTIYLFSDGYADQFGGSKGNKFMYKPFKEMLLAIQEQNMASQKDHIEDTFSQWKKDIMQLDDVCVFGVRI